MSEGISIFIKVLLVVLGIVAIFIIVDLVFLDYTSWIGSKREDIRRDIYESTKSYNEGKEQDLIRYRLQWLQTNDEEKPAIESTIRMMFADYDYSELEPVLQDFLKTILYGE